MNTKNQIERAFKFSPTSQEVRSLLEDNEPWFVAKDICDILEIQRTNDALQKLDDDEKLMRKISASGQNRKMWLVNESGLYALILRSSKPEAKTFRKWVTKEVLPSIRKKGYYGTNKGHNTDFIDVRDVPYEEKEINGFNVRYIKVDDTVWVSINDVNKAIHASTQSQQVAKQLNVKQTLAIKIWLYGNTHPAWFANELGLKLILSGSRKLRNANQLTIGL